MNTIIYITLDNIIVRCSGTAQWCAKPDWFSTRGGTTRVHCAIDHVPSYNLSHGIVLFFPNCTMHVVPPLVSSSTSVAC